MARETTWHKSSYSGATNNCVEVAESSRGALVRDTQSRERGHLTFGAEEWTAFLHHVRAEAR
ncbi:uncharacterized protein DUF397 [Murinocardiopsis flavida]|uniref:Uncharacterized protein DUF397 n=1 Tax=Murinocardiopsis flavida TaxID=645275 RepID=A0A2P8D962_9ACTN|nr:DUF397 domain-containing protein [Murinocardiopsis flavida]PSK93742.1 uncharacterized protein DUF397 [Murinocardiopsis flavida]